MNEPLRIGKIIGGILLVLATVAGGTDIRLGQSASASKLDAIARQITAQGVQMTEQGRLLSTIAERQEVIHQRVQVLEQDKGDAEEREELRKIVLEELWAESARKFRSKQAAAGQ